MTASVGLMRRRHTGALALTALGAALAVTAVAAAPGEATHRTDHRHHRTASTGSAPSAGSGTRSGTAHDRQAVVSGYGRLPVAFEANRGQAPAEVRYLAHGPGYNLFVTDHDTVVTLHTPAARHDRHHALARFRHRLRRTSVAGTRTALPTAPTKSATLHLRPLAASPRPVVQGTQPLPGKVNYLTGAKRAGWHTGIDTYSRVVTSGVWPGVDWAWYGTNQNLEYDLSLAPGADPTLARFEIDGAKSVRLDRQGNLLVGTAAGTLTERAPIAWQETAQGARRPVQATWRLLGGHRVGFGLGSYDHTRAVTIDPTLLYSTYLGGNGLFDEPSGIAVDATGAAYVTGSVLATNFPTTPGAFQPTSPAKGSGAGMFAYNAFVSKLSPDGSTLLYSTYLGGNLYDVAHGIALNPTCAANCAAYVTGFTASSTFPTTPGAFLTTAPTPGAGTSTNSGSGFVTELDPAGDALAYSTYLGGTDGSNAFAIAVDTAGAAYVTGAGGANFPTTPNAYLPSSGLGGAPFVTKIVPTAGAPLAYSTFLGGGGGPDSGDGIAVDPTGAAYVTGISYAAVLPTTPNAFQPTRPVKSASLYSAFVTKLSSTGHDALYYTWLGGTGQDFGSSIAVDPTCPSNCAAYIAGVTTSSNFPTTTGAFQPSEPTKTAGSDNAFVTKMSADGTALVYSTYLGGNGDDDGYSLAVNRSGEVYLTGYTTSSNFPTTGDAFQATAPAKTGGATDSAFLTRLNATGSALGYSTYLGGNGDDSGGAVAVDPSGAAYLTGITFSSNFPTTAGALQTTAPAKTAGGDSGFVAKLGDKGGRGAPAGAPAPGHAHHSRCSSSASNDPGPC